MSSVSVYCHFAALHWWRGSPARSVGVHADVLLHCAARCIVRHGDQRSPAAGEDARARTSNLKTLPDCVREDEGRLRAGRE